MAHRRKPQLPIAATKKLPNSNYIIELRGETWSRLIPADTEQQAFRLAREAQDDAKRNNYKVGIFVHRFVRDKMPVWVKWPDDAKGGKPKRVPQGPIRANPLRGVDSVGEGYT